MRGWGMKKSFMERMAAFIVDKRRLFVVLFAVACVLSVFSVSKTDVNNALSDTPHGCPVRTRRRCTRRQNFALSHSRESRCGGKNSSGIRYSNTDPDHDTQPR